MGESSKHYEHVCRGLVEVYCCQIDIKTMPGLMQEQIAWIEENLHNLNKEFDSFVEKMDLEQGLAELFIPAFEQENTSTVSEQYKLDEDHSSFIEKIESDQESTKFFMQAFKL